MFVDLLGPARIDLDSMSSIQHTIDRQPGQYLGHTSTVTLADGKSILLAYPKGHGSGPIVLRRSNDFGGTWSEPIETPKSWATSRETPTLFRINNRLLLWSGLYPARIASSTDNGQRWTELETAGEWGGIVLMGSLVQTGKRTAVAFFHDDGRFFRSVADPSVRFTLYSTRTNDEGRTWTYPTPIYSDASLQLCEPGAVRSPDGKTLALLLRENSRKHASQIMFSTDQGKSWTLPRALPAGLTGDRHTARYLKDGRLLVSFRFMPPEDPWKGDWVAWLGTWDDLVNGREGSALVRLKDNKDSWDCGYPGLEVGADGTVFAVTYGHWAVGEEPYILGLRFGSKVIDGH